MSTKSGPGHAPVSAQPNPKLCRPPRNGRNKLAQRLRKEASSKVKKEV
jgi:hypothetical protein